MRLFRLYDGPVLPYNYSPSLTRVSTEVRVLPGLHESQSAVSASEGVRVVVHPPDTEPFPFAEGFDVPPGFSASFGVRPRKNVRIGEPYGRCHEQNPFEKDNGSGRRRQYRGIACQKMCLQSHIIRKCNCSDASLPTLPGTKVASCRQSDAFPTSCMHEASIHCLNVREECWVIDCYIAVIIT